MFVADDTSPCVRRVRACVVCRSRFVSRREERTKSASTWPMPGIRCSATRCTSPAAFLDHAPSYLRSFVTLCEFILCSSLAFILRLPLHTRSAQTEEDHEERYRRELQQGENNEGDDHDSHKSEDGAQEVEDDINGVPGDLGYFLHSWKLVFAHPTATSSNRSAAEQRIRIVCPPPPAFRAAWGQQWPLPSQ